MIACVETQDGHRVGPAFSGLGASILDLFVGQATAGAAAADQSFYNFAKGSTLLSGQRASTAIIVGGIVAAAAVAGLLYWGLKS